MRKVKPLVLPFFCEGYDRDAAAEQMIEEGSSGAEYNATDVLANGGVEASLEEMRAAYTAALEEIATEYGLTNEM